MVPERSRAVIVDDGFRSIIGHPQEELENRLTPRRAGLTPRRADTQETTEDTAAENGCGISHGGPGQRCGRQPDAATEIVGAGPEPGSPLGGHG